MKNRLFFKGMAGSVLAVVMVLVGCDNPAGDDGGGNTPDCTVSFDVGEGAGTAPANKTVRSGQSIQLPGQENMTAPSGKIFSGWRMGGQNYAEGYSYTVTGDTTFFAQWQTSGGTGDNGGTSAPGAPTGVTAAALSSSSISVSWNAVSDAASYKVYYELGSSSTKNLAGTVTGTQFTHTGLTAGTTYFYYIKSVNTSGLESSYSSYAYATTGSSSGGISVPSAPTGVTATRQSASTVLVSWNPVTGATSYKVYWSYTSTGTYTLAGSTSYTTYTDTGWGASETGYFKVKAVNSAGESAFSSYASFGAYTSNWPPGNLVGTFTTTGQVDDNSLTSSTAVKWYKIRFTSTTYVKIMGIDRQSGDAYGKTADIVATVYDSAGTVLNNQVNVGFVGSIERYILANNDYYLKVEINPASGYTGTYRIGIIE
ncbi:MAG: fibronectin type III domain-containing protein [Treponema sp.]|jgi:hypothetical protein|nr:fibronectin type III domain-containing protein [Treponema sp.]